MTVDDLRNLMTFNRMTDRTTLGLKLLVVSLLVLNITDVAKAETQPCYTTGISVDQYEYRSSETVTINCTVYSGVGQPVDMSPLTIQRRSRNSPTVQNVSIDHRIGNLAVARIEGSQLPALNTFTCRYGTCRPSFRSFRTVIVRQEELLSVSRADVDCVYILYAEQLICKFSCKQTSQPGGCLWTLQYKIETSSSYECCRINNTEPQSGCPFSYGSSCVVPNVQSFVSYKMKLSQVDGNGNISKEFTVQPNSSIMEIRPVVDVQVESQHRQLSISMTLGTSPKFADGITCLVTYTSEWEPAQSKNVSFNYTSSSIHVTNNLLRNLEPYTLYNISIKCKPVCSRYWSQPTVVSGRTLPELPVHLPTVVTYTDQRLADSGARYIILYWKHVAKRFWYGNETQYSVTESSENITDLFPASSTTARLREPVNTSLPYTLLIGGENECGASVVSQQYHIQQYQTDINKMRVVVEEDLPSTWLVTLFNPVDTGTYTPIQVFWCQTQYDHKDPPICQNEIEYTTSNSTTGELLHMSLNPPLQGLVWAFGVSIGSSATIWSACTFYYKSGEFSADETLEVSVMQSSTNSTVVDVYLRFDFCQLSRRPVMYQVSIVDASDKEGCQESATKNITAMPGLSHFTMETNIKSETKLCFRLVFTSTNATNFARFTVIEAAAVYIGPSRDPSSSNGVAAGLAVAAVITLVFLVTLGCIKLRRKLTKTYVIKDFPINLDEPNQDGTSEINSYEAQSHNWYTIVDQSEGSTLSGSYKQDSLTKLHDDTDGIGESGVTKDGYLIPVNQRIMHQRDTDSTDKEGNSSLITDPAYVQRIDAPLLTPVREISDSGSVTLDDIQTTNEDISRSNIFMADSISNNTDHTYGTVATQSINSDNSDLVKTSPSLNYVRFSDGIVNRPTTHVIAQNNGRSCTNSASPIPFYIQCGREHEFSARPAMAVRNNNTTAPYVQPQLAAVALSKPPSFMPNASAQPVRTTQAMMVSPIPSEMNNLGPGPIGMAVNQGYVQEHSLVGSVSTGSHGRSRSGINDYVGNRTMDELSVNVRENSFRTTVSSGNNENYEASNSHQNNRSSSPIDRDGNGDSSSMVIPDYVISETQYQPANSINLQSQSPQLTVIQDYTVAALIDSGSSGGVNSGMGDYVVSTAVNE